MPLPEPCHALRRLGAAAALLGMLGLTACTGSPVPIFDPQRADVVAERGQARVATADGLAAVTRPYAVRSSATIDSCAPGQDNWKSRDPWSQRCWFSYSGVIVLPSIATAPTMVADGLTQLGCDDPRQLADALAKWGELNPGEPLPADPDFQPGVLPPELNQCGNREVWIRFSSPHDSLLEVVAADAASTRDPLVVRATPFSATELSRLRAGSSPVIVFVTVRTMYHQEPR